MTMNRNLISSVVMGALLIAAPGRVAATPFPVVTDEHVDAVSFTYSPSTGLRGRVKTDSETFFPGAVLVYDGPSGTSGITRPGGSQWDFLGVGAGQTVYYWPQTSMNGRIFAGFDAAGIASGTFASYQPADPRITTAARWLRTDLVAVRYFDLAGNPGAAEFSMWSISGLGGSPVVWMSTANGISGSDSYFLTEGGHAHVNWGFSKPGYYQLDFRLSGRLASNSQTVESPVTTWHFGVEHVPAAIPEPAGLGLLLLALAAGAFLFLRRRIQTHRHQP